MKLFKQYVDKNPDGVINNRWGLSQGDPYDGEGHSKAAKKDVPALKKMKFWKKVQCPAE